MNAITRYLALLVSVFAATNAAAVDAMGQAQFQVFRKNACHEVGVMGVTGLKFKELGGRLAKYSPKLVPDYFYEDEHRPLLVLAKWSLEFGETKARNVQEAYETAVAKCVDNIERVYRDERSHQLTKESELD